MTEEQPEEQSADSSGVLEGVAPLDPEATVGFEIGQEVGGRFVVEDVLGTSEGGTSYLVREKSGKRKMVLKVLDLIVNEETAYNNLRDEIKQGSKVRHKNLVQVYGLGREAGAVFVAMEYVEGRTLWREVSKRREKSQPLNPQTVFNIVGHISNALVTVHRTTNHGTLTPGNVYLTTKGKVKVSNLVFGRIVSAALYTKGEGIYRTSPFMAPEVLADPSAVSILSDVYSVGMITVELLADEELTGLGEEAREAALKIARGYSEAFHDLIAKATEPDPTARMEEVADFRDELKELIEGMTGGEEGAEAKEEEEQTAEATDASGQKITFRSPDADKGEFAMGQTVSLDALRDEDDPNDPFAKAFEILGKTRDLSDQGVVWGGDTDESRYLVSKDGLDYGPYNYEEVVAQLHRDEIDEFSFILDRITQDRVALGDMKLFTKAVEEYLPVRQEKRRRIEEQRKQVIDTAKTAGKWTVVVGVVAGMLVGVVFAIYWFYIRPEPSPMPEEVLMADLGPSYKMLPPPREFTEVGLPKGVLAAIFAEEDPSQTLKKYRRKLRRKKGKDGKPLSPGEEEENISTLDFESGGSDRVLTDAEINRTIMARMGSIGGCVRKELKRNPRFKGVSVRFYIKPTGTTGGVKVLGKGSPPVQSCLKGHFRTMKFPSHGGLNKGVTFPLRIQ